MCEHTTCLICFGPWAYAGEDGICAECRGKLSPLYVSNVLGETRRAPHVYPDGAWTCPFCGSAAGETTSPWFVYPCANPQCEANPHMPADVILTRRAELAERKRREEERKRIHADAMRRSEQWREQRAREVQEARENGYCVQCFVRSGNRKRIRHRSADYHAVAA